MEQSSHDRAYTQGIKVMQLIGGSFDEATLLRIGAAFQRATDFHNRAPEFA